MNANTETSAQLFLAGAPSAAVGGRTHALAAPDAWLLAWLALEGPTSRERLAALLWPASDAESARGALRQRLFRLRRQLGMELLAGTTLLALAEGVDHDLAGGATLLADLQLPESPAADAWLAERRAERRALARRAALAGVDALEAAGDAAAALPQVRALLQHEPLAEDLHQRLMRLHYLAGDRAAALLAFDRCEALLKHEVGTAPSPQTLALLATIQAAGLPAGAQAPPAVLPVAVLRPPRLVGRDAELHSLQRSLDQGAVVLLVGEAGMGKSRLLQTLAAGALSATFAGRALYSAARPGDALVPYATLTRLLRAAVERAPDSADPALRAALAPLLPEWAPGGLPPALAAPPLQPVATLLGRSAPVLLLDDLHFADPATLELLPGLVGGSVTGAVASRWALGLRPPPAHSPLQALLALLARDTAHQQLLLQPLTPAQVAEFVDSLGLPGVSGSDWATSLHQRSGGNPLFLLETLKLAWADGRPATPEALPRPPSLTGLIAEQLARLSAPALQLARVAAVAGVDFGITLAESLLSRSALELADAWAELEQRQVLRGTAFAHDLVHDAVLQGLPEVIARHLHGQCAAWLETGGGEPARIAAHWEAAGQRARAVPALRTAAEQAHRALREGERITLLLHAADIAEDGGRGDEAFELVRQAVEAHMNTLRQTDGLPLLDRLDALAATPWQRARAAADRAWYSAVLGELEQALALGRQALALAEALGDEALRAQVRQRLGTTLGMLGRFEESLQQLQAVAPWIAQHAPRDEQAEFEGNQAVVLDNLGRHNEAQAHHLRAIAQAQAEPAARATLLANYAASRLEAGDLAAGADHAAQAQRIVAGYELAGSSAGFVAVLTAQCERAAWRFGSALAWCDRAEAILTERNPTRLPVARLQRAAIWLDLAQHARALQLLDGEALEAALALPARYAVRALLLRARVLERLGQDPADALAQAAARAPDHGWPQLALQVRCEQALNAQDLPALRSAADDAATRQLHGTELGALLYASALAADLRHADAEALARRALALAAHTEAWHTDRALRWWAPARALAAAGLADEAAALADSGVQALRQALAGEVAAEFAEAFGHRHPLHAALLGGRLGG